MKTLFITSSKKDVLTGILLALWVIIGAVLLVTFIPVIYAMHIETFHLPTITGLSSHEVMTSYQAVISYLGLGATGFMKVPHFAMTQHTLIHFKEVKMIFTVLEIFMIVASLALIPLIYSCLKDHEVQFLKLGAIVTGLIAGIVSLFGMMNFEAAFNLMHQLLFRNTYWIIDPQLDPIINLFPETYFAYLGIAIALLIIGAIILMSLIYRLYCHHIKKQSVL